MYIYIYIYIYIENITHITYIIIHYICAQMNVTQITTTKKWQLNYTATCFTRIV